MVVVCTDKLFVQHLRCVDALKGVGFPVEHDKSIREAVFLSKLLPTEQALEANELAVTLEACAELVRVTEECRCCIRRALDPDWRVVRSRPLPVLLPVTAGAQALPRCDRTPGFS